MRKLKSIVAAVLLIATLGACKKDHTPGFSNDDKIQTAKFTVTATGFTTYSIVSASFGAISLSNAKTLWKVNGKTMSNEPYITLGPDDFKATPTITVELATSVTSINASLQMVANQAANFKLSYKAEINGKVVADDENASTQGEDGYTHEYTY